MNSFKKCCGALCVLNTLLIRGLQNSKTIITSPAKKLKINETEQPFYYFKTEITISRALYNFGFKFCLDTFILEVGGWRV